MLAYTKMWKLLETKGMRRSDLKQVISSATLAKLGKNEPISSTVIEKLCNFLDCQPGDIMEYIRDEDLELLGKQLEDATKIMLDALKTKGITEEQFTTMLMQELPSYIKELSNGENPIQEAIKAEKEKQGNAEEN